MKSMFLKMLLMDENRQCNETDLQFGLDKACLEVTSSSNPCTLWTHSEECDMVN